jgi:putative DNA primase/helicase
MVVEHDPVAVDLAGLITDEMPKPPKPLFDGPSVWAEPYEVFTGEKSSTWTPRNAAENLRASGLHVARGGGDLYVFRDGHYVPGESWLRKLLAQQLGEHWRSGRTDDVVTYLRAVAPDLWERPPRDRINVTNGLLDLGTGDLVAHDPDFLSPVQIPVSFDQDADCPAVDQFMRQVFPADSIQLAYEWLGLLIVPDTAMQRALLLIGSGANGKSRYLGLATALVGPENVSTRTLQEIVDDRFAAADLYGKLANISPDIPSTALRAADLFKRLTGEDRISAQRKYGSAFDFSPYARLLFSGQEIPPSPDASYAYRRRWMTLRFEHTFDGKPCAACGATHQRDERLLERITTPRELSGLLNLALLSYVGLRDRGAFSETESTLAGAAELDEAVDDSANFLDECCQGAPGASVSRTELYRTYRAWAEQAGHRPVRDRTFYERVRGRGFDETKYEGKRRFSGLAIRATSGAAT